MRKFVLAMLAMVLPALASAAPPVQPAPPAKTPAPPGSGPQPRAVPQPPKAVRIDPPLKLSAGERTQLHTAWKAAAKAYKVDKNVAKLKQAGKAMPAAAADVWAGWMTKLSERPKARLAGKTEMPGLGPWNYVIESSVVTGYWLFTDHCRIRVDLNITLNNLGSPYPAAETWREIHAYPPWLSPFDVAAVNHYPLPRLLSGQRQTVAVGIQEYWLSASTPTGDNCLTASAQPVGYIDLKVYELGGLWRVRWGGFADPTISVGFVDEPTPEEVLTDLFD